MVLIVWPISNMFLIALVGYDTDITKSINHCKKIFSMTLPTSDSVNTLYMPKDENQTKLHHSDYATSSTVVNGSATMPSHFAGSDSSSSFPLRRFSNMTVLDMDGNADYVKAKGESLNDTIGTTANVESHQQQT